MATRVPTFVRVTDDLMRVTWTGLLNGDDGQPVQENYAQYADRSVQVLGTFGAGGSIRAEGSNDGGANFAPYTDPQGNDVNLTAAKGEQLMESFGQMRPRVTAGDGTTTLTCVLNMRRSRPKAA